MMGHKTIIRAAAAAFWVWIAMGPPALAGADPLSVADFSRAVPDGPLPGEWKPQVFEKIRRHTEYRVVRVDGRVAVRARSDNAASGLVRKIAIDPGRYPVIRWAWKVSGVLENGDVTRKSGDDYAARIYVTFAYDPDRAGFLEKARYETARLLYGRYPPAGALVYCWANKADKGSISPNPFTDRAQMIAVQTGPDRAGTWAVETRNIAEDYRTAYGRAPSMISGVAIMTDTDNTGESVTAWYGDIVFLRK
jgi:Protein of unknown function (DUF3047)